MTVAAEEAVASSSDNSYSVGVFWDTVLPVPAAVTPEVADPMKGLVEPETNKNHSIEVTHTKVTHICEPCDSAVNSG